MPCIKDGALQYEMTLKYSLANAKKEMHTTHLQLMQLSALTITSLTSLFAALIGVLFSISIISIRILKTKGQIISDRQSLFISIWILLVSNARDDGI